MLRTLITLLTAAGLTLFIGAPLANETLVANLTHNGTSDTGLPGDLQAMNGTSDTGLPSDLQAMNGTSDTGLPSDFR